MGYYRIINGIKWYYRLKPKKEDNNTNNNNKQGLFSDHPRHTLTNALIVALSYRDPFDDKEYLLFTSFKSYLEYAIYQLKLQPHERCFYEIILGENSQKPHFDIDIDNMEKNGDQIRDNLIDSIIKVLKDKGIDIDINKDVLIYTSHGNAKQSYHVVINNYCHTNNVEARAFYDNVMDHVNPEYVQWIDKAVYNPLQQLRTLGSRKIGTNRCKIFLKKWSYHGSDIEYQYPEDPDGPEHEMVMQLEASIVSFTGNCKFLPAFEPRIHKNTTYIESDDIDIKDAKDALSLVAAAGKIKTTDPRFPYKFLGINGPIVMLKRTKPSNCRICNRIHENENPYLLVVGEEKSVYFHCRRAPESKKLFLGKLAPNPDNPATTDNPDGKNNNSKNNSKNNNKNDDDPNNDNDKMNLVRSTWTKNVLDRVHKVAQQNNGKEKKIITSSTEIDPEYKKQLIQIFVDSK